MMMSKRWYTKKASCDQGLIIDEDTGRSVAVAYNYRDGDLIAAAPELLEALQGLLPMWESGIDEPWVVAARAAIAKATGGK